MNALKLQKLNIYIPPHWDNIGEGYDILKHKKEEILIALNQSHPHRCSDCNGTAVNLLIQFSCNKCTPEESIDGFWANPLNMSEKLTTEQRLELSPTHSENAPELPQNLQDLLMIEELITEEEMRLEKEEEREERMERHFQNVGSCYAGEEIEWLI